MPEMRIRVGALGIVDIKKGTYCYVGSAMNGLDQRIRRHLSEKKTLHWHIDYLTNECVSIKAYEVPAGVAECEICAIVRKNGGKAAIKGFGCSDCRCETHLFFLDGDSKENLCSELFLSQNSH